MARPPKKAPAQPAPVAKKAAKDVLSRAVEASSAKVADLETAVQKAASKPTDAIKQAAKRAPAPPAAPVKPAQDVPARKTQAAPQPVASTRKTAGPLTGQPREPDDADRVAAEHVAAAQEATSLPAPVLETESVPPAVAADPVSPPPAPAAETPAPVEPAIAASAETTPEAASIETSPAPQPEAAPVTASEPEREAEPTPPVAAADPEPPPPAPAAETPASVEPAIAAPTETAPEAAPVETIPEPAPVLAKAAAVETVPTRVGQCASETMQASLASFADGLVAINAKALEALRANAGMTYDLIKSLIGVTNPSEVMSIYAAHARHRLEVTSEQAREIQALAAKITAEAALPLSKRIA